MDGQMRMVGWEPVAQRVQIHRGIFFLISAPLFLHER